MSKFFEHFGAVRCCFVHYYAHIAKFPANSLELSDKRLRIKFRICPKELLTAGSNKSIRHYIFVSANIWRMYPLSARRPESMVVVYFTLENASSSVNMVYPCDFRHDIRLFTAYRRCKLPCGLHGLCGEQLVFCMSCSIYAEFS